jgi:hypothetical protein
MEGLVRGGANEKFHPSLRTWHTVRHGMTLNPEMPMITPPHKDDQA